MQNPRSRSAFTLIELLVVISIIAILASLALPAINGALETARRAQAKNDATQIANAIIAYETEYGRLPFATGTGDVVVTANQHAALFSALSGSTNETAVPNPRGLTFLEVKDATKGLKNGTNSTGFLDSWKQPYFIVIDGNYDNTIDLSTGGAPTAETRKRVGVYSTGKVGNTNPDRYIKSWE